MPAGQSGLFDPSLEPEPKPRAGRRLSVLITVKAAPNPIRHRQRAVCCSASAIRSGYACPSPSSVRQSRTSAVPRAHRVGSASIARTSSSCRVRYAPVCAARGCHDASGEVAGAAEVSASATSSIHPAACQGKTLTGTRPPSKVRGSGTRRRLVSPAPGWSPPRAAPAPISRHASRTRGPQNAMGQQSQHPCCQDSQRHHRQAARCAVRARSGRSVRMPTAISICGRIVSVSCPHRDAGRRVCGLCGFGRGTGGGRGPWSQSCW